MEQIRLEAEPRSVVGKQVRRLRAEGWIPAILYGKGVSPMPLKIKAATWRRFTATGLGRGLVELYVQGQEKPYFALIREVQRDPITRQVWHVDFQQVSMTETLRVEVPVAVVGASPVVERGDGVLLVGLTHLEVECLPTAIPSSIEVDASALKAIGDSITVADLALPEGVKVIAEPEEMVLTVVPAGLPEEEAVVEEGEPELIRKARAAEEEEEAEE
ncbi:MAG: 50S ribosomal protein L25 [Anaerolineae bacterium]